MRRVERALVKEYRSLVDHALENLDATTREVALELCELPELVRGYENIKLASVDRFQVAARQLLERDGDSPEDGLVLIDAGRRS